MEVTKFKRHKSGLQEPIYHKTRSNDATMLRHQPIKLEHSISFPHPRLCSAKTNVCVLYLAFSDTPHRGRGGCVRFRVNTFDVLAIRFDDFLNGARGSLDRESWVEAEVILVDEDSFYIEVSSLKTS